MNQLAKVSTYLAMLMAGLIGISLSVPLQSPAVILMGVAGVSAGFSMIFGGGMGSCQKGGARWLAILVSVALAYFVLRACWSPVLDLGVEDLMLILPAGLLYLIAGVTISGASGAKLRQGLVWIVVLLLILNLGSAVLQLLGSEGYSLSMMLTSSTRASEGGLTGMYGYMGSFANFVLIAGLLSLSMGIWGKLAPWLRWTMLLLGICALVFTGLSHSRSAIVSMLVAVPVMGVLVYLSVSHQHNSDRKKIRSLIVALVVGALLVGVIGGVKVFQHRANETSGIDIAFDSGVRTAFWPMAIEQWQDHPVIGAGSRSFSYECFSYWSPNLDTAENNPEFVHNEYLQLLADYGAIGLVLIVLIICGHLIFATRRIRFIASQLGDASLRQGSNSMAQVIAGACGMIAMSVHVIFDFRTHLLANLLLLVLCAVWVLPVIKSKNPDSARSVKLIDYLRVSMLLVVSVSVLWLGVLQLWGGMPLLQNQIAKEDGEWSPDKLPKKQWAAALESSVERAPTFRRHLKLGAIYQAEAMESDGENRRVLLDRAIEHYNAATKRHSHNLVSQINVAKIETDRGNFKTADEIYRSISLEASSRERWFRMHSLWAATQLRWAYVTEKKNMHDEAEIHYLQSLNLYKKSSEIGNFNLNQEWLIDYSRALLMYSRFLDSQKKFDEAEVILKECMGLTDWARNSKFTGLYVERGRHFYWKARHLWFNRKPEEAAKMVKISLQMYAGQKQISNGQINDAWRQGYKEAKEMDDFFKNTGVGQKRKGVEH